MVHPWDSVYAILQKVKSAIISRKNTLKYILVCTIKTTIQNKVYIHNIYIWLLTLLTTKKGIFARLDILFTFERPLFVLMRPAASQIKTFFYFFLLFLSIRIICFKNTIKLFFYYANNENKYKRTTLIFNFFLFY